MGQVKWRGQDLNSNLFSLGHVLLVLISERVCARVCVCVCGVYLHVHGKKCICLNELNA